MEKGTEKITTVKVNNGRTGFNVDYLASMSLKDAQAAFKKHDPKLVKEAHAQAVKIKKENDKAAK